MTIEENEIGEVKTPEQLAADKEAAQQARIEAAEKAKQEAELKAARAEGEAEALKQGFRAGVSSPPPAAISEEQWQAMEAESGMDRKQIQANAKLTGALLQNLTKPLVDRTEAAEREARESREEIKKLKSRQSSEKIESDFYSKNPGLSAHRGDIEEFLGMLPESVKEDPKKYGEALEKAKTFVRGKAREDLSLRRSGKQPGNSEVPEFSDESGTGKQEPELDLSDLDNDGERRLIANLAKNPGGFSHGSENEKPLSSLSKEEAYKKCERKDGKGVNINDDADWRAGERLADQRLREAAK